MVASVKARDLFLRFGLTALLLCLPALAFSQESLGDDQPEPSASTRDATDIAGSAATLNGRVNANGPPTDVSFQYGTSQSYGDTVDASPSRVNGNAEQDVRATISGLQPNTTYHFRVVAAGNHGTVFGNNRSFTTDDEGAPPPVPEPPESPSLEGPLDRAVDISVNPRLSWSNASGATSYRLQVSANSNFTDPIVNLPGISETSYQVNGLDHATTYHWRVRSINEHGQSDWSSSYRFTTTGIEIEAPSLSSPANHSEGVSLTPNLSWNSVALAESYTVQVSFDDEFSDTVVNRSGVGSTSYRIQEGTLDGSTVYYWRVRAHGLLGPGAWSSVWRFTTGGEPPEVTTRSPAQVSETSATLRGRVNPRGQETEVYFEWGRNDNYGETTSRTSISAGNGDQDFEFALAQLEPGTTYHYRAVGINSSGTARGENRTFSTGAEQISNAPALSVPQNGASNVSPNLTLRWESVDGAESYTLQISTNSNFSGSEVNQSGISDTNYDASSDNLDEHTQYYWRVRAAAEGGSGPWSSAWNFTTSSPRIKALTDPATDVSATSATLNGTVNARGGSVSAVFEYGTTQEYGETITANQSPVTGDSDRGVDVTLSNLEPNTTYHYRLVATDDEETVTGQNRNFTTAEQAQFAPGLTSPEDGSIDVPIPVTLRWRSVSRARHYEVEVATDAGFSDNSRVFSANNVTETQQTITDLDPGTTYFWRVRATLLLRNTEWSDVWRFTTLPDPPSATTEPASGVTSESAMLNARVNPHGGRTTVYFEWGSNTSYGNRTSERDIGVDNESVSVSAEIGGLEPATTYHYRVVATNSGGTSRGEDVSLTTTEPPTSPELVSPFDGARGVPVHAVLEWRSVPSANNYTIEIATQPSFSETAMVLNKNGHSSTSFEATDLEPGTTYYWRVRASSSGSDGPWSEIFSFVTYPQMVPLTVNRTFGNAGRSSSFRMVSLPGDIRMPLADVLPGEHENDWIAFLDDGNENGELLPYDGSAAFEFAPGRAFWVLSRRAWTFSDDATPVPLTTERTFEITLHDGWNLISNPFDDAISWSEVQALNNISEELWAFTGSFQTASVMLAYEGYYFHNADGLSRLELPYPGAVDPDDFDMNLRTFPAVTISATSDGQSLSSVRMGILETREGMAEVADQLAPPSRFEDIGLRLHKTGSDTPGARYAVTYGLMAEGGHKFRMVLHATPGEAVEILLEDLPKSAQIAEVRAIDEKVGRQYDLGETRRFSYVPSEKITRFSVLIGDRQFVEASASEILPERVQLFPNYPNPFNPQTTLEFALPQSEYVRLTVYDALGRVVRTLADGYHEAGFHTSTWDGRDQAGSPVSSGIYFGRLEVGTFVQTKKMTLIK